MMDIQIRLAAPDDTAEILAMVRELGAHQDEVEHVRLTAEGLAAACFGPDPDASVLVAEGEGGLVGFVSYMIRYNLWHDARFISLDDLYVREAGRGQGIGRALMTALARIALDRGMAVRWEVRNDNARAVEFYRRLGAAVRPKSICWWEEDAMRAALSPAR